MGNTPSTIVNKIVIPNKFWNRQKSGELLDSLKSISNEDIQKIWKEMEKAREIRLQREEEEKEKSEKVENLEWDIDAILKNLKENHVKIEEDVKMMWYKWKKVYIDLPAVWNFGWFKFDYFVSDDRVINSDLRKKSIFNKPLEGKLYSKKEVVELLNAINKYMAELHVKNDWDMDYENELKYGETNKYWCKAWDYLKTIAWLDAWYWLKDRYTSWKRHFRANLYCNYSDCYFVYSTDNSVAKLFLRLSD